MNEWSIKIHFGSFHSLLLCARHWGMYFTGIVLPQLIGPHKVSAFIMAVL